MGIKIQWDNSDRTIYLVEMDNDFTWPDFREKVEAAYQTIGVTPHKVDLILCFGQMLPHGDALTHMKFAGGRQPANIRHSVIVNQTGAFIETVVRRVDRSENWVGPTIVQTIDEARTLLAKLQAEADADETQA